MPRYQIKRSAVDPQVRERLVNILANELRGQASAQGPAVFEEEVTGTDTFHVLVLWEQWQDIPTEERGAMILDAYERSAAEVAPRITVTLGVTLDEALAMNLLPYQVSPMRKSSHPVSYAELEAAMRAEGAVQTPAGLRMYFPSRKAAEDAYQRLSARIAGPYWAILQGQETPEDQS
jgi:hypothetical protein